MTPIIINRILGIVFILLAVILTFVFPCPSKAQYLAIYLLAGLGIALMFTKSASQSKVKTKIYNVTIVLTGAVALPFTLFFTNPIDSFKPKNCDPVSKEISLTVFVHGEKGKQDMILRQNGKVVLDLKGERKTASINEYGQAFFQNMHIGDKITGLNIDFSEPYRAVHPDSIYTIGADGQIYLEVALRGIDHVFGRVFYSGEPLPDVTVTIDTLSVHSDSFGRFDIHIPSALQRNKYDVGFSKKTFKFQSAPALPQTAEPLEVIMEKK